MSKEKERRQVCTQWVTLASYGPYSKDLKEKKKRKNITYSHEVTTQKGKRLMPPETVLGVSYWAGGDITKFSNVRALFHRTVKLQKYGCLGVSDWQKYSYFQRQKHGCLITFNTRHVAILPPLMILSNHF